MLAIPFIKSHRRTPSGRKQLDITLNVEELTKEERISRSLHTGVRKTSNAADRPRLFEWFLVIGVPPKVIPKEEDTSSSTSSTKPPISTTSSPPPTHKPSPPPLLRSSGLNHPNSSSSSSNNSNTNGNGNFGPRTEQPKILYQYPPDKPLGGLNIENFPFPSGIQVNMVSQTASHTNVFQLLYTQKHIKQPEDSFDEKKEVLYGVCTTKITSIGSLLEGEKFEIDINEEPRKNDYVKIGEYIPTAQRCYCILSKYPFFPLHFNVLAGVLVLQHVQEITRFQNLMGGFTSQKKQHATINTAGADCDIVTVSDTSKDCILSNESKPVLQLIEYFYAQNIPSPGNKISYSLPNLDTTISFRRGSQKDKDDVTADYNDYLLEYGLFTTVQLLTHKTIIIILSAVLLEKPVVFYSKSIRCLTSVIYSVLSLLKPFTYQSVILPILPQSFSINDFLSAPVPYIIGLTSIPPQDLLTDIVLVDIDQNKIQSKTPVPLLPKWKTLGNKIIEVTRELKNTMTSKQLSYVATEDQESILKTFSIAIETHLIGLFDHFSRHCIRDVSQLKERVSVFVKETFASVEFEEEEENHWITEFMSTLMFSVYLDKKLRSQDEDHP
eukprot:gene3290-4121_t